MGISLGGFLPHVMSTTLGCIFRISAVHGGLGEWGLSETRWQRKPFPNEVLPCDKSVTRDICCFGFWDGWHFVARRGKGKSVAHSTHSSSKMCDETPWGLNSGTSDMHNNNKTACCNTGGLAAAVEWETDVCRSLFNLSNYSTVWELFLQFGTQIVLVTHYSSTWRTKFSNWPSKLHHTLFDGDEPTWMPVWTAMTAIKEASLLHSVER